MTTATPWPREEVEHLDLGVTVERCIDSREGIPAPDARWAFKGKIVEVIYRGVNPSGKAYVGFYTTFGENGGRLSGSVREGEQTLRIVED